MKYSDICKAFYISEGKSGLKEYTTQDKIAQVLIELGYKEGTKGKAELIFQQTYPELDLDPVGDSKAYNRTHGLWLVQHDLYYLFLRWSDTDGIRDHW